MVRTRGCIITDRVSEETDKWYTMKANNTSSSVPLAFCLLPRRSQNTAAFLSAFCSSTVIKLTHLQPSSFFFEMRSTSSVPCRSMQGGIPVKKVLSVLLHSHSIVHTHHTHASVRMYTHLCLLHDVGLCPYPLNELPFSDKDKYIPRVEGCRWGLHQDGLDMATA